jgi:hypothetical protein
VGAANANAPAIANTARFAIICFLPDQWIMSRDIEK